jgi:hypothetical protein
MTLPTGEGGSTQPLSVVPPRVVGNDPTLSVVLPRVVGNDPTLSVVLLRFPPPLWGGVGGEVAGGVVGEVAIVFFIFHFSTF